MEDARNVRWDRASVEEVRRWLGPEEERELTAEEDRVLEYPWPITILSQDTVWGDAMSATVSATLGFDEIQGAEDYELRLSVVPVKNSLVLPPITTWPLNGNGTVSGTGIILTTASFQQKTSVVCPTTTDADWTEISLSFTMAQPTSSADGFAVGIIDAAYYTTSYIGDSGAGVGFYWGAYGTPNFDNIIKHYCVYDESVYVPTGNEGPTLRWNDGTTKAYSGIPNAGWNPAGTHTYNITFTKTGSHLATGTVTWDGTTILHVTNMWVPDNSYVIVTAATGDAYNQHQIDNFLGLVDY